MKETRNYIHENEKFFVEARRHLHKYPELSSEEYKTAEYIRGWLDKWNIPYKKVGNTSTVAIIKGKRDKPVIAIRGDIDALPIEEKTGLEFSSCNEGVMHACGHDFHTSFMLGSAKILKEISDELEGTVKIIFQEGEEIGKGAADIVKTDLLDDVDVIAGLHMDMAAPLGNFCVGYGTMSSFGGGANIEIYDGKYENAIQIASTLIQLITQRSFMAFKGSEQVVLVPTVIKTDTDNNANKVTLAYNFRTLNIDNIQTIKEILSTVPDYVKTITESNIITNLIVHTNVVNNEKSATDRAVKVIQRVFGDDAITYGNPFMGGEDFSIYQQRIPGVFLHLGGVSDGKYGALHTETTNFDEKALGIGIEFLIEYVLDFFNETV